MEKRPAKTVLLIENQLEEARRIREMLNDPGSSIFELSHVESMNDAEKHLATRTVDIVLLDLGLADPQGLEAVRLVRTAAPHHGDLRAKQGYTVAMAVEESRLLQVTIFSTLHRSQKHLEFSKVLPDVVTIADEVDAQLKQQMLCFMAADEAKFAKTA
jgi:CheY-like chemotaxis protein